MSCTNFDNIPTCPNIKCGGSGDLPFRKVNIPAVMGTDAADQPEAPYNGKYQNALVEYQSNGALYIYSSDGIYTKLSYKAES